MPRTAALLQLHWSTVSNLNVSVKVLLLSAYAAQSHVHWQDGLQQMLPDWQWTVLSLPPRHFSWRVRGNPLYWSIAERECLEQEYDLLLATSMVDLATLRGLVPALARLPAAVYFHENQFEYPQHQQQHSLVEAQMVSLYAALSADRILFNSAYNWDSFLGGCATLLAKLPDKVPPGVVDMLRDRASVLPVPLLIPETSAIEPRWPGRQGRFPARPVRLLWAGRFEHDKGGERLRALLALLEEAGLDFELAVIGQQFRNSPAVFAQIATQFEHRLVQFGFMPSADDYHALLCAADLVVATAEHEFQGLAVLEAVASGCVPVVPDRLAYREMYPAQYRYASHLDDPEREAVAARELIVALVASLASAELAAPDVSTFGWQQLAPRYRRILQALVQPQDSQ
jgi:glycosyltransferase involved in cell wall biosynthesis